LEPNHQLHSSLKLDVKRGKQAFSMFLHAMNFAEQLTSASASASANDQVRTYIFSELSSRSDFDRFASGLAEHKYDIRFPSAQFAPQASGHPPTRHVTGLLSSGLRVYFQVGNGNPLLDLHCMASADVFWPAVSWFSAASAILNQGIKASRRQVQQLIQIYTQLLTAV
jgi:hypothetical protein